MSAARPLAPWVRTRLRTSRTAALLLAVLVLGTTFLAVALPRTLDRDSDHAVAKLLDDASPTARSLTAQVTNDQGSGGIGGIGRAGGLTGYRQQVLDTVAKTLPAELSGPLAAAPGRRPTAPRPPSPAT